MMTERRTYLNDDREEDRLLKGRIFVIKRASIVLELKHRLPNTHQPHPPRACISRIRCFRHRT